MKLNQVIAIEQGLKTKGNATLTGQYHLEQKGLLFDGMVRNYKPLQEDGEKLPSEKKLVQFRAAEVIKQLSIDVSEWFSIEFAKDVGNLSATADVKVGGEVLVKDAPVTYLMFLEKQLVHVGTFVSKLPTLDPAEEWEWDNTTNYWRSKITQTAKTKKVQAALLLAPATDKHPAQAVQITDDRLVGYWEQTRLSGALTQEQKNVFMDKVEALTKAVKLAREEANQIDVVRSSAETNLLSWIFTT